MRRLYGAVSAFSLATLASRTPLAALVLLAGLLLGSPPASALPPASGSKCSSDWVNNAGAMACFIQGEEDLRNGVAHPHYVACTAAGEVFCCVDKAGGQDCEAVRTTGVHRPPEIENLKVQAMLEAQRSIATILGRVSARLDHLASRMANPGSGAGCGIGSGMVSLYGPGIGIGPAEMYGPQPGDAEDSALDLSDEQRGRIDKIRQDLRRKQWDLMGRIQDEFAGRADAPDDATADKIDDRIGELRQQMMSNETAARKQTDAVLTPEQRRELRRGRP
jgi:Spy/CpxP family protein refolding chaperone